MYETIKAKDIVEGYKMTYKFNASHSMTNKTMAHTHTFLVHLYITKSEKGFIEFYEYEIAIKQYLNKYKGVYLNDLFEEKPTLEFLCDKFYTDIERILTTASFNLLSLELGDSPINSVKIGKAIVASRANIHITEEDFELCKKGLVCLNANI